MSLPSSLGLLALLFPSLRRALDHKDKLLLDVARLNKLLKSKEKHILELKGEAVTLTEELSDADQNVNELEALDIVLRAKVKKLEKEIENPMVRLKELPDERSNCYVWLIPHERDINEFRTMLAETYIERLGREPKAMHLVLHKVEDIALFTRSEVKTKLKSWLQE